MSQTQKSDDSPASPCSGVCTLDAARKLCVGCLRSGKEIKEWAHASPARRHAILDAVHARRAAAPPAANEQNENQQPGASHEG